MHVVGVPFTARRVVNQTEQLGFACYHTDIIDNNGWLGNAAPHHAAVVHLHIPIPLVSPFELPLFTH